MNLFSTLFGNDCLFQESSIVGLCGLRKKTEYVCIEIPKEFKKTHFTNVENNFFLI